MQEADSGWGQTVEVEQRGLVRTGCGGWAFCVQWLMLSTTGQETLFLEVLLTVKASVLREQGVLAANEASVFLSGIKVKNHKTIRWASPAGFSRASPAGFSSIYPLTTLKSLSCSSNGKKSACDAGDQSLIPGSGRSSGEGDGNSLQYSCLENSMDRGTWQATVCGVTKSQT